MKKVNSFFWWCAGVHSELLEKCPSEHSKYFGIGATVFFTGLFASISVGYALATIFDRMYPAILVSILWGLMIFNLDRYIVSGIRKKEKFRNEFLMALPRLFLATLIAFTISKPLELKIFEKEITAELAVIRKEKQAEMDSLIQNRYEKELVAIETKNNQINETLRKKGESRDNLTAEAQKEADGTGGSGLRNPGPIYKIKKQDALIAQREYDSLKNISSKVFTENTKRQSRIDSIINTEKNLAQGELEYNGFAARIEALERLTQKSNSILFANFFILLLFLAIETAPVFVKLISEKGPYDNLLFVYEHEVEMDSLSTISQKKNKTLSKNKNLISELKNWLTVKVLGK